MAENATDRRDFLKTFLAAVPAVALDWDSFPRGNRDQTAPPRGKWDAVIIGSGLGGLSAAAAFARQGFKALVIEQHSAAGGYATTFKRRGGFVFDASLHSTTVGERNGGFNLIPGFPEIRDIEFVPHRVLYRAIFPGHDIRVPHRDLEGYVSILTGHFPDEREGIQNLFKGMRGLAEDIGRYSRAGGKIDMSKVPREFPYLFQNSNRTWGDFMDAHIQNPRLKAVVSALWVYFGLPPSKLANIYYALPVIGYLEQGGFYPVGRSQKISDSLVKFIEERGGKVILKTWVESILTKGHAAIGVKTADGKIYPARAVISNANAYDTFHTMMDEKDYLRDYLVRMDQFSVSLSSFQVFLGLKKDLVKETGVTDTEIFYCPDYDHETAYRQALNAEVEKGGFCLMLYDNLYQGYSPRGKNTITILTLQGYEPWKKYEADYFQGKKGDYRAEKERMAAILIKKAEETLLPGLTKAIDVKEIATPLTNLRYTRNFRGAIYGWDQTLDNSSLRRLARRTPIQNLYLAGAWTDPGHGYGAVIPSGLQCFADVMKDWS